MRFIGLLIICCSVLVSCSQKKETVEPILKIALASEVPTIDPANCYDTVCAQVVYQVYETLFEYEYLKRPYVLRPLIAAEMPHVENNGLLYTIKIKKDIPYHTHANVPTGRTVKAQDIITAIKRLAYIPTQSQGWWLFEGKIVGLDEWRESIGQNFEMFFDTPVKGLRATDDHTLVIQLKTPFPQLLFALAMTFTAPQPAEAVKSLNNDLTQNMIGTGPFALKTYQQNQLVDLVRFKDYRTSVFPSHGDRFANEKKLLTDSGKKLPFLDGISFIVMKEAQTSWLNFMSGKIDYVNLTKDYYQVALTADNKVSPELAEKGIELQISPTLIYWWLSFNMRDPIVKNIWLRKAIAHAVDVDKFVKLFTNNVGQKSNSIYPPGIPGYDPSATLPYKLDLELAREMLVKAGYPEGKGLPEITFDVRGNSTINRQMAEFIQQELAQVGIKIKISVNPFPTFLEKSRRGELQFWMGGWVLDYPDAENVLGLLVTPNFPPGSNYNFYSNKKVDELYERLKKIEDGPEKLAIMTEIESQINQDLPWAMLYYSRNYVLHHGRLKNFRYSDLIYNTMKYYRLE